MISIESAEPLCHAEDCSSTEFEGGFIDDAENMGEPLIRCCRLFNFQRAEFTIALNN